MKYILPILFLLCVFNPAFAQNAADPTMTGEQMLVHCQDKWGSRTSAVAQCVTTLRFAVSESRDEQIVARLDQGEERNGEILERLADLSDQVADLAAAQRPAVTPQVQITPAANGGAAWAPVAQPTVVSIHSITGMIPDTLHITALDHSNARSACGGVGATYVVFLDHGVPVSNVYAPAGAPTGFLEVYWDKNADGIPDGTVMGLDLASQTDVWITWSQANDLTVRYLRPGAQIVVDGLPLQTVYHPTTRSEASASGAVDCDRDASARHGGHQDTPAYSLSRMW